MKYHFSGSRCLRLLSGVFLVLLLPVWPAVSAEEVYVSKQGVRFFRVQGPVESRITLFDSGGFITWTNAATNATFVLQSALGLGQGVNWYDYIRVPVTGPVTTLQVVAPNLPQNMAFIPAGSFEMGDAFNEGEVSERPVHTVQVSAFYMERYEVWNALWREVYAWATAHGYSFDNPGSTYPQPGPNYYDHGPTHPVQSINWYDAVKWCNARSERAGLSPAYYTNAAHTGVYRTGRMILSNAMVDWNAGYRLPTEAEWEKAARGGLSGRRFPWGDTIGHTRANYWSIASAYDVSATRGYHPDYQGQGFPYSNPVVLLGDNGYELFNVAGNVYEWCWDQYSGVGYGAAPVTDPRGPEVASASRRYRGGMWYNTAFAARCSYRSYEAADKAGIYVGLRCVLPAATPLPAVAH